MNSRARSFIKAGEVKAIDEEHRRKILKATSTYDDAVESMKVLQFQDWQEARRIAALIKDHVLAQLPEYLERFEERASARGVQILWAGDASEARQHVRDIIGRHGARKVVKTKSMTTEEIGFNSMLESSGIEVWESDLGELIVQLAGERPYHIVTPAMHKSKSDVAALFHDKLGAPATAEAEELTMVARAHLRDAYITADIGFSGANFLIAEEGAVVMTENEGNGRLTMSCPPVHVVIAGIEKVLPSLRDLDLFLPLLATSGTGQKLTCYNSIIRGLRAPDEPDGPEHMYVILLDNGRSDIYARATHRQSLRCIRCGACLNACPVFRTVGGHAYDTAYPGPIGSVITPLLLGIEEWSHLSFASSLCGSCSDVCPVSIDLHHLLLENRHLALRRPRAGLMWKFAMKLWAFAVSSRRRLQILRRLARLGEPLLPLLVSRSKRHRLPRLAKRSFAQIWKERDRGQS